MANLGLEQFKAGIQLAEVARNTSDKTQAKKLTKQAFQLINNGSKALMDFPDNWCGTPPVPRPWPRLNWSEVEIQLSQAEVLGQLATIQRNVGLEDVKSAVGAEIKAIASQIVR
jgi:hypothetical protein